VGVPRAAQPPTRAGGFVFEVAQFGGGADLRASVLAMTRVLIPSYVRNSGHHPGRPIRVALVEKADGGTNTPHACVVGYDPAEDPAHPDPSFLHLLAHEPFHTWLGDVGHLQGSESITWFHEGFTDYLSLWHLASVKQIEPGWFADRILTLEALARGSSALGRTAFAQEGGWRDGDGARETLAYKGGAILALGLDVALRTQRKPGLMEMISDLGRTVEGPVSLADVRGWMESHGQAAFYERYVAAPALPDARGLLREAGFTWAERPAESGGTGAVTVDRERLARFLAFTGR
jgi:predicted metalloprotease with PDZ domain